VELVGIDYSGLEYGQMATYCKYGICYSVLVPSWHESITCV